VQDLRQRLTAWTELGLLTTEQADAIERHERERSRFVPGDTDTAGDTDTDADADADAPALSRGDAEPPSRRIAVAEAVGYVGAALAVAALALFVADVWPELTTGGQLALVGLLSVLAAGAGYAVHGQPVAAMRRLTGVLWASASLGCAWFAGIVAWDIVDAGSEATATTVGVVAAMIAVPLLLRRPGLPLHVIGLGGAVTAAASALSMSALQPDVFWHGLLAAAISGAWLLLARGGWIAPARTGEVLGGVAALIALQVGSFGDLRVAALVLSLVLAIGLVALAVLREAGYHLVVGALGLFVLVPQLVFEIFGDAIGAPATLLVVGLLLVLLAVGLGRVRREVGSDHRRDDGELPGSGTSRLGDDRLGADR
jgi:hypothetical protein